MTIIVIVTNIGDKVSCPTIDIGIAFVLIECEALVIAITLALEVSSNGPDFPSVGIFRG